MASEWRETTLGNEVDLLTGFPFKSQDYTDAPDGIRLLRGDNIVQGTLRWDGAKLWPHSGITEYETYQLSPGDIVLAMDRPWIEVGLKYACLTQYDVPCLLVQRVSRLRGRSHLDSRFLRYVIGSRAFTDHVLAVQTGTAVPHISASQIKSFPFCCPPLPEQKAIAHILGTLDDKIELNRRMNETLETMARAIFKSWFVDFDPVRAKMDGRKPEGMDAATAKLFPDGFEESEVGLIPKGWTVLPLDRIATFLNGLALQKFPPDDAENALPVIKIVQLRAGAPDGADLASANVPSAYVVNDGDVLFSWSGSLMAGVWCGGRGALNQHLFKVTSDSFPAWFCCYWILEHLPDFQRIAAGKATTMGHIQRHHLSSALTVTAPDAVMCAADKVLGPIWAKTVATRIESRFLAAIRDALLPKLLSGEVRAVSIETIVGGATR